MALPGQSVSVKLAEAGRNFTSATLDGKKVNGLLSGAPVQVSIPGRPLKQPWHRKLGDLHPVAVPADAEALYEATCFSAENNALEVRCVQRSGPTGIPEVQSARDAFFTNSFFVAKGIWDKNLFDGRMDPQFNQAPAWDEKPTHGGALRLDFGAPIAMDRLVMRGSRVQLPHGPDAGLNAEVSADLTNWRPTQVSREKDRITAIIPMASKELVLT
jgi:hypothetical protein